MQLTIPPYSDHEPLLRRLRRMGRILTGDQKVADSVLENAFVRARSAIRPGNSLITASDIFKLGFDAFDDAVHRKGVVVILNRAGTRDGSLGERVNQLSYVERVAIALLLVENMTPRGAAILSGRPASLLENSLVTAIDLLDDADWTSET
ncbi:hypothetical protein [Henriciella pelagia]|uniref:Uncharacterized protein n=2 Tax=Hyphomonadaceae TaxID=69657 RepID=A0ABQ1J8A2_9PROT|nr:hypothetical protein [Henriciella pelagia]GGB62255.1 hypothetical protein GCM10011503_08610 [Henriciella pelagia]